MTRLVDTSVVIKWFVAEDGQQAAEALIGTSLVAPDLLLVEVSNVAWKKWRRGEIGEDQAFAAQEAVTSFVSLLPSQPLAPAALAIALELGHPVYDCYFLAACELNRSPLVTADQRLLNACSGTRFERLVEPLV